MTQKNRTWDILEKGNGCQDHPLDFSNETTRLGYYIGLSFFLALFCVFGGIAQNQKQETPEVWPTIAWPEANPGAVGMDSTSLFVSAVCPLKYDSDTNCPFLITSRL